MHLTSLLLFLSAPTAIQAHASLAPHLASDLPLPRPAISPRDTPVAAAENGTTTTLVVEFAPNYVQLPQTPCPPFPPPLTHITAL